MFLSVLDTKVFVSQIKLLNHCKEDKLFLSFYPDKFVFGNNTLCFIYYQDNTNGVLDNTYESCTFILDSQMLIKAKDTKTPKGNSYLFVDEETLQGGLYVECQGTGYQLALETIENTEITITNISSESSKIILSPQALTNLYNLSRNYGKAYLTSSYLVGFSDIACGFSKLGLADEEFCYSFELKASLINGLNKLTDFFFLSLEDNVKFFDNIERPSFIFINGVQDSLDETQKLILELFNSIEQCTKVELGSGKEFYSIINTAKSFSDTLVLTETGSIGYIQDSQVIEYANIDIVLERDLYFSQKELDKCLYNFKASKALSMYYDSLVFFSADNNSHYEVIIPYRVINIHNENTGN
jgi:hypothetical protein